MNALMGDAKEALKMRKRVRKLQDVANMDRFIFLPGISMQHIFEVIVWDVYSFIYIYSVEY